MSMKRLSLAFLVLLAAATASTLGRWYWSRCRSEAEQAEPWHDVAAPSPDEVNVEV
jgi:hypothetical protein